MRVVAFTMELNNIDFQEAENDSSTITAETRKHLEHCAQVSQVSDADP